MKRGPPRQRHPNASQSWERHSHPTHPAPSLPLSPPSAYDFVVIGDSNSPCLEYPMPIPVLEPRSPSPAPPAPGSRAPCPPTIFDSPPVLPAVASAKYGSPPLEELRASPLPTENYREIHSYPATPVIPTWHRHKKWGANTAVQLVIEDTLFEIPEKVLSGSRRWRDRRSPFSQAEDDTFEILGVAISEMESFMTVLDARAVDNSLDELSLEDWSSVLHLSTLWEFESIRQHAISVFDSKFFDQDPLARLLLAQTCNVSGWHRPAYRRLCERDRTLAKEEAEALGYARAMAITRIQSEIQKLKYGDLERRLADTEVTLAARCPRQECKMKFEVKGIALGQGAEFAVRVDETAVLDLIDGASELSSV